MPSHVAPIEGASLIRAREQTPHAIFALMLSQSRASRSLALAEPFGDEPDDFTGRRLPGFLDRLLALAVRRFLADAQLLGDRLLQGLDRLLVRRLERQSRIIARAIRP